MWNDGDYREAFQAFKRALDEVPAPVSDHPEATRAVVGLADCYYQLGKYELAMKPLEDALLLPGGAANPYVRLRRGQVLAHLGEMDKARIEWTTAYLNGGDAVFENEADWKPELEKVASELRSMVSQ
jgi:tetratricopeptide (TPR) repeat protein